MQRSVAGVTALHFGPVSDIQLAILFIAFTDKRTAEEMKLNRTPLPNGAALVAKPPTGMRPGFPVMNLDGQAVANRHSPGPLTSLPKQSRITTEMRDPPVTVIGPGGAVKVVR